MTRRSRRNKHIKILRNRCLFLLSIIGIFILLYKSYIYFHTSKITNNKVISATQLTGGKVYKNQSYKKDKENGNERNTNEANNNEENSDENKDYNINTKVNLSNEVENNNSGNVSDYGRQYTYDVQKVKDILDNKLES
ncbi:hypothetical protein ACJDU8_03075 [Clostridium sp. WILCCON 0269]|uniref:Uncharacterized protein n=1 Tax=Candidatus Clostridium eludens TaxID=3381663 RepID=A0ABW8SFM6_9CLOT